MTATVLVIGGGGQLGAPVAHRLLDDGFGVRVLVRANSPARAKGTEEVLGDVDDIAALRIYCDLTAPGVTVTSRPLWLMAALDRTILRGSLGDTVPLMHALQELGEQGDQSEAARLLGPATTKGPIMTKVRYCRRGNVCHL